MSEEIPLFPVSGFESQTYLTRNSHSFIVTQVNPDFIGTFFIFPGRHGVRYGFPCKTGLIETFEKCATQI
jgi:hypothetical protein